MQTHRLYYVAAETAGQAALAVADGAEFWEDIDPAQDMAEELGVNVYVIEATYVAKKLSWLP